MDSLSKRIALSLLQIKAIKLSPANYFTWASGWHSPIYCDNRRILSHPAARALVADAFAERIRALYPEAGVIAAVATGAIAHGALAAERCGLPFVYVRAAAKQHGLENRIEGELPEGARVVVVEDLVSTGMSSLAAVEALRAAGARVEGMVAIFTYGFPVADEAFRRARVRLDTLSDYNALIALAVEQGAVDAEQLRTLRAWREHPDRWPEAADPAAAGA